MVRSLGSHYAVLMNRGDRVDHLFSRAGANLHRDLVG